MSAQPAGQPRPRSGRDLSGVLERRCRRLMRVYPAAYRREREDEIIGTLLDATPGGRSWPRLRDARALITGGLAARSASNARLSTLTNLRLSVLLGLAIYLSFYVGGYVSYGRGAFAWNRWPTLLPALLIVLVLLLAWLARRIAVLTAAAAAAVVIVVASASAPLVFRTVLVLLLPLVVFTALAMSAQRPPRAWLWLPGCAVAAFLLAGLATAVHWYTAGLYMQDIVFVLLGVVCIAWLVVDARPAIGLASFFLLLGLTSLADDLIVMPGPDTVAVLSAMWPLLAIVLALAVPAAWRLRRQARHRQPTQ
jgi:hypothetical protein